MGTIGFVSSPADACDEGATTGYERVRRRLLESGAAGVIDAKETAG